MKLFDAFSEPGFHTTIATSFAIDFMAYEQIVLTRLRESGCMNNIVIADARMLTYALDDAQRPPLQAGRRYSLVGAEAPGLFHPKLTLQLGADCARLIVASANLTASGLAGNLEVVGEVRLDAGDDGHIPIIREALDFIERFVPPSEQGARKQLDWARARSPWLQRSLLEPGAGDARLLASGESAGIGRRYIDLVGDEAVTRLVLVSPYWDENLSAVRFLQESLRPKKTVLAIQPDRGLFPGKKGLKADICEVLPLIKPRDRFAHAKVLVAQTRKADHVLFGSPNCTIAALGAGTTPGMNVEAALYKRMAAGAAIAALDLAKVVDGHVLKEAEIAPYVRAAEIPLEQAAARQPGRFQLRSNQLTWTPAPAFDTPDAVLELLDARQELVLADPPAIGQANSRLYRVDASEPPRFARVRVGERLSGVGVVHVEELILENLRVAKTKRIQDGLDKLAGGDLEGLFLYEALELIDAEERRIMTGGARGSARSRAKPSEAEHRTLTYEDFLRARGEGPAPDMVPGNSLASSHANEVRALLNTLIGIAEVAPSTSPGEEAGLAMPLGLGDETADGEGALEEGLEVDAEPVRDGAAGSHAAAGAATREQDTEEAIALAVGRFNERIAEAADRRALTTRDLLRVRVLLTIILASGSSRLYRRQATPSDRPPVLLAKGDRSWPRLAGQVLFRLFASVWDGKPLIQQVNLHQEEQGNDVPIDVLECLATCFWAVGALALARDERQSATEVATRAHQRAAEMYGMTILDLGDLESAPVLKTMQALSARYAARLGLEAAELAAFHARLSAASPALKAQWLTSQQLAAAG